nr:XdhC family protein [Burkholderia sp. BCC1970]
MCDPREEYANTWNVPSTCLTRAMADDTVLDVQLDGHSTVVALTHDPKFDDLVLIHALQTDASYVAAIGSRLNDSKRRERRKLFDIADAWLARLRGPAGLAIGSRTPPELAVAIAAEWTSAKNGVALDIEWAEKIGADESQEYARAGGPLVAPDVCPALFALEAR